MAEGDKSFWTTLPGLFTGAAAVLTAGTTFYATVVRDPAPPAPPAPAPQVTSVALPTTSAAAPGASQTAPASAWKDQLIGIWYAETQDPADQGGTITTRGTTEYFRNGSSQYMGEVVISAVQPGGKVDVIYNVLATGEWQAHGQHLVEKIVDMKSTPRTVRVNGVAIEFAALDPKAAASLPRLEDLIPRGVANDSEVLEIGALSARMRVRGANGEQRVENISRRDRHFSAN